MPTTDFQILESHLLTFNCDLDYIAHDSGLSFTKQDDLKSIRFQVKAEHLPIISIGAFSLITNKRKYY